MHWNNLFLMSYRKRIHGSREIFEKPIKNWHQIISAWNSIWIQILPAAVLLSELERLYESCEIIIRWAKHLSSAKPPAGPPKLELLQGADVFSKMVRSTPPAGQKWKSDRWSRIFTKRTQYRRVGLHMLVLGISSAVDSNSTEKIMQFGPVKSLEFEF